MSQLSPLDAYFKACEEETAVVLPRRSLAILRLDGRAFHKYLRHADKPFDVAFASAMGTVAIALCTEVQGAVMAYQQSDEVSILIDGTTGAHSEMWFGGKVQKIVSVSAGIASAVLTTVHDEADELGTFDARVFTLSAPSDVASYFRWRQRDARRNSTMMTARSVFSHNECQGKKTGELQEMLKLAGNGWDMQPAIFRQGVLCRPVRRTSTITYTHRQTGAEITQEVERRVWTLEEAPYFYSGTDWLDEIYREAGYATA